MPGRRLGLLTDILASNLRDPQLPYRAQLVTTYRCNFRCEMCGIWKKKSVDEITPDEVAGFFRRWPQFSWINLSGGEIFMRRDVDDIVRAMQENCGSLFMINFPTTGWFGDRTVALANQILDHGIGRLMVTISIDGPKAVHEELRGLPGSWDRGIETFRRLRGIRRPNFQAVVGMTLLAKNAHLVDATIAAIREVIPDFSRNELHLNVGHESTHYFDNTGYEGGGPRAATLSGTGPAPAGNRNVVAPGRVPRGSLPGAGRQLLRDRQVAAAVHGAFDQLLHRRALEPVSVLDLGREGRQPAGGQLRPRRALELRTRAGTARDRWSTRTARTAGRRAKPTRRSSPTCRKRS